jgi:hypothetical protein
MSLPARLGDVDERVRILLRTKMAGGQSVSDEKKWDELIYLMILFVFSCRRFLK